MPRRQRKRSPEAWLEALRQQLADVENTPGLGLLCVLGALTGILCGGVILAMHALIELLRGPVFAAAGLETDGLDQATPLLRILIPTFGALLLGLLVTWLLRAPRQYGIVHVIERLVYYQGHLPVRAAVVEFFVSALAVTSGQSVGREGVAAHMGATTGSWLSRRLDLPKNSVRTLVGCGAAAGIAASFNTPLAAVIFAMEVVMMEYTIAGFAPIIIAAVSGALVTFNLTEIHPQLNTGHPGMHSLMEVPYLVFLGAVLGLAAAAFTRLTGLLTRWLEPVPTTARMTLAGLGTGLLAAAFPQILGLGFDTVNLALAGEIALWLALGVAAAKLAATALATAAAIPGGVILPTFVIGASLGGALGSLGGLLAPEHASNPGFYALIGVGAMVGGVLHAPLTALVTLLELSDRTEMVLPGMLAVITAIVVARRVAGPESIFRMLLRHRGLDYRNDPVSQYLRRASVAVAMNRRIRVVEPRMAAADLHRMLEAHQPDWLLIRESDSRVSLIRPAEILRYLKDQADSQSNAAGAEIVLSEIPGKRLEAIAIDLRASLQEAHDQLEKQHTDAVYVAGRRPRDKPTIYGVLTPDDIERAYHP